MSTFKLAKSAGLGFAVADELRIVLESVRARAD
jgi:hypothetical protein